MTYKVEEVGEKGEIVIGEELREKLGIGLGWRAYQILEDDHLKIYFIPPDPLAGSLAKYVNEDNSFSDEDWHKVRDEAWRKAIEEDYDNEWRNDREYAGKVRAEEKMGLRERS